MEDIHLHIGGLKGLHASPTEFLAYFIIRSPHPRDKTYLPKARLDVKRMPK
jgi:hypothetical protein